MLSGLDVILKAFVLTCTATLTTSTDAISKKQIAAQCLQAMFVLRSCDMTRAEQRRKLTLYIYIYLR